MKTTAANTQQGGIAILVALMIIVLMSAIGFGASRNVIREVSITGDAVQGAKAASSADAGLDWFQSWTFSKTATGSGGTGATIASTLQNLEDRLTLDSNGQTTTSLLAANEMVIPKPSDSQLQQNYDITIRYLGKMGTTGTGRGGNAAGPQGGGSKLLDNLWQVTATGRSTVLDASNNPIFAFRNVREALSVTPPQQ